MNVSPGLKPFLNVKGSVFTGCVSLLFFKQERDYYSISTQIVNESK